MKLKYLVAASPFLREIANLPVSDVRSSYRLALFLNKVEPHLKAYNIAYEALVKKYAKPDSEINENNKSVQIPKENVEPFNREMIELGRDEIDITPPNISIKNYKTIDCQPNLFYRLFGIIFDMVPITSNPLVDITRMEAYDAFAALTSLGSKPLKEDIQQKLIENGAMLFEVLKYCDEEQEKLRKENKDLDEFFRGTIAVPYNKIKLNDLSRYPIEPSVLAKLSWMIEE